MNRYEWITLGIVVVAFVWGLYETKKYPAVTWQDLDDLKELKEDERV